MPGYINAEMSAVPTCFQSVMLYLTPGMTTLIAELRGGCGCWAYRLDRASQPPLHHHHHPAAHARQAVRPHITTLSPGAVFGTQADVFYETPLWEKLQLIRGLCLMNS